MDKPTPYSWLSPKVEIFNTEKYDLGVKAISQIDKDEVVAVVGGHILTIEDENRLLKEGGKSVDKWIEISDQFSIGPVTDDEIKLTPHVHINHSCSPNLGFQGQIFLVAMRSIKVGEEVCFDYAMCMCGSEASVANFEMECLCQTPDCRGKITENDWQKPDLQQKYNGYFQLFLQRKIDKTQ